jgi:hypothetical protein
VPFSVVQCSTVQSSTEQYLVGEVVLRTPAMLVAQTRQRVWKRLGGRPRLHACGGGGVGRTERENDILRLHIDNKCKQIRTIHENAGLSTPFLEKEHQHMFGLLIKVQCTAAQYMYTYVPEETSGAAGCRAPRRSEYARSIQGWR